MANYERAQYLARTRLPHRQRRREQVSRQQSSAKPIEVHGKVHRTILITNAHMGLE